MPKISCPICGETGSQFVTKRFDGGPIVRCESCHHHYLNPPVPKDCLDEIYRRYHFNQSDDRLLGMLQAWFNEADSPYRGALESMEDFGGLQGKQVLDIGCGPGVFLHECERRGAKVLGIDPSPHAVRIAKEKFGIEVLPYTIEDLPKKNRLPCERFDYVFAFELIEHVREPGPLICLMQQLLKPGGVLFLSTPNFAQYYRMGNAAQVVNAWPEHLHYFDPRSLKNCVEKYGFHVEELETKQALRVGEQKKRVWAQSPAIQRVWRLIKRVRLLRELKDYFFAILNRKGASKDLWGGLHLTLVAIKASD